MSLAVIEGGLHVHTWRPQVWMEASGLDGAIALVHKGAAAVCLATRGGRKGGSGVEGVKGMKGVEGGRVGRTGG